MNLPKNAFPPSIVNLLLQEGQRWEVDGSFREALGTGIIPIVASARGGKTSLAYVMIDYVVRHTKRPVILDSFPQKVIDEGIPEHWKGRVSNEKFADLAKINQPAVWLLDDNAVHYNSRDSMTNSSKLLARAAGVLSHFGGGMTVIFTTQLLSGIDLSFLRFTTLAPVIRYIDPDVINQERKEWKGVVEQGQFELRKVCKDYRFRDYFYCSKDRILCPAAFPSWLDKEVDPIKADYLSRPMRYHEEEDRLAMISGEVKKARRTRKKEVEE
jgi:hypothetical protein